MKQLFALLFSFISYVDMFLFDYMCFQYRAEEKSCMLFQVRDELEHLLDDDEDMTQLYLTRKWLQNQQNEGLSGGVGSISFTNGAQHLRRLSSVKSGSMMTSANLNDDDVEDLEMLLEAYFMQLDGTRNKILSVSK